MTGNMAAAESGLLLGIIAVLSLQPAAGRPARMTEAMEDWGYVTVRKDAHMFWWLYYANHPTRNYTEVPLVMWLQGGPGASGCGFGNFEEIGPRDTNLFIRNSSWDRVASLLFVDNPVGSGYSYTTDGAAFAKDVDTVASDMMVLLDVVFKSKPEFQKTPFYIFSESYGGKMAAAIGLVLQKAITAGRISCTFGGVALGDSWISPIDSVLSWGPYLYSISLLDDTGLQEVQAAASAVQDALSKGQFTLATDLWSKTEDVIEENTDGVNFYNILSKESLMRRSAVEFSRPWIGEITPRKGLAGGEESPLLIWEWWEERRRPLWRHWGSSGPRPHGLGLIPLSACSPFLMGVILFGQCRVRVKQCGNILLNHKTGR
ncbi:retinoid-inducible serine carboxypeptidase [Dendrobates tinctorius]|uniref:retinoid-inducible serine carboxypeptidase n=1 Tax=Dendrobates tinctorius TaxID=92724 RepID=UPI003CC95CA9